MLDMQKSAHGPVPKRKMTVEIINLTGKATRLKARRVNEEAVAAEAVAEAQLTGMPASACRHGGGVANSYGYAAETEGCLALALPTGECVAYLVRLSANKVTLRGVVSTVASKSGSTAAKACVCAYDGRYSHAIRELMRSARDAAIVFEARCRRDENVLYSQVNAR